MCSTAFYRLDGIAPALSGHSAIIVAHDQPAFRPSPSPTLLASLNVLAQSPLPVGSAGDARLPPAVRSRRHLHARRRSGWPPMAGTWTISGNEITLQNDPGRRNATAPRRYTFSVDGAAFGLDVVADDCQARRMILDRSRWLPPGTAPIGARAPHRPHRRAPAKTPLPPATPAPATGRRSAAAKPSGIADGQNLPDTLESGDRREHPVAHADSRARAFEPDRVGRPRLRDHRDQQPRQRDVQAGPVRRRRRVRRSLAASLDALRDRQADRQDSLGATAAQGEPRNKRHIKSTYASASPATDGRIVVAWFGSQGVYAYDVDGGLRWKVDLGRVDMGAYDIPALRVGTGELADHLERPGDRAVRHAGRFVPARARRRHRRDGVENAIARSCRRGARRRSSRHAAGPELVTNASNFIRGYDPTHRQGAVAARRQLEDHGADADLRRRPAHHRERPRAGAADLCRAARRARRSDAGEWRDRQARRWRGARPAAVLTCRRRSPIAGSSTCSPTTACSTPTNLRPARRSIASGLPLVGSGFSASPVAADGKIYLSNEDGEMLVVEAGATFKHIATNSMGETLMATPALSDGVMYVRGVDAVRDRRRRAACEAGRYARLRPCRAPS